MLLKTRHLDAHWLPPRRGAGTLRGMMRTVASSLFVAALLPGLLACGGNLSESDPLHNARPRARLSAPLVAPPGLPVVLDAGNSFDPDGTVVEYTFVLSDDSPPVSLSTPELVHSFQQTGAFEVAVVVRDEGGLLARVNQLVVVRDDVPSCEDSSECGIGEECRDSLCYTNSDLRSDALAECAVAQDCGSGWTCWAGVCLAK